MLGSRFVGGHGPRGPENAYWLRPDAANDMADRPSDLLGVVAATLFLGAWSLFDGLAAVGFGVGWTAVPAVVLGTLQAVMGALLLVASAGLYGRRPWARWLGLILLGGGSLVRAVPLFQGRMPPLLGLAVYAGAFLYLSLGGDLVADDTGGSRRAETMDPHQLEQ